MTFSLGYYKIGYAMSSLIAFAVGMEGLEPSTLTGYASETYAYTSSATCPYAYLTIQTIICGHNSKLTVTNLDRDTERNLHTSTK